MRVKSLKGGDAMRRASSSSRSPLYLTDMRGDNTARPALRIFDGCYSAGRGKS